MDPTEIPSHIRVYPTPIPDSAFVASGARVIGDGSVQAKHLNPVFIDMDDHAVFTVTGRKIDRTNIDGT